MLTRLFFFFLPLYFLFFTPSFALTGKVVKVTDGDTVTVLTNDFEQIKIRLYGIDAPERKQPFGTRSRQTLAGMVAGKVVNVDVINKDRYGRQVGIISVDGQNANREMVKSGMAWVYDHYCKKAFCREWQNLEDKARSARLGLWLDANPLPPWDWRKAKRKK